MARTSQIVAACIMIPYVACGAALCKLVLDRKHCGSLYYYFPVEEDDADGTKRLRSYDNRFCGGGNHGILSLIGTLLIGLTIIIYRLLVGTRTRVVKYIHMALHTITLILLSFGLWCIFNHKYSMTYDRINFHGISSWVIFAIFCVQFVVAALIYSYQYPNTKLRLFIAPFHDIAGIWLYICCVACCISGRSRAQVDYVGANQDYFNGLSYVCFSCILIVILSPFYEWDVIGPL